jgi:pyruvate kinase
MESQTSLRKTKIVCTIGPATGSPGGLKMLMEAGMNVARLNFSHGDREAHREMIRNLRRISEETGREIGILQDLGGPKIRLGKLNVEARHLEAGETVVLQAAESSDSEIVPVNYPYLLEDVNIGDRLLLADGTVELSVQDKKDGNIMCRVQVGGELKSLKGINLPSSRLRIPAFTEKDRDDLAVGIEEQVDFVAMSFVRNEQDLDPVLKILDRQKRRPLLIAKIEKPQAVENFDRILAAVDGIMVARGDLGVEMPLEDVPIIQKRLIHATRLAGKPVITATQMLTSMMTSNRPTRAEATDVANAILDGTDALMLSDETAVGSFPKDAVLILDRIAKATEPFLKGPLLGELHDGPVASTSSAVSHAAALMAADLHAAAIIASTSSGSTARMVARFRPDCPVFALTSRIETQRQLTISYGVMPERVEAFVHTFKAAQTTIARKGIGRAGDRLIITAGIPIGTQGTTNLIKIVEL